MKLRQSLEGKIALLAGALVLASALLTVLLSDLLGSLLGGLLITLALMAIVSVFIVRRFMRPINRLISALGDGVASFKDGDFSISLNASRDDELGRLIQHYNLAGEYLRHERQHLYQRELLLDTVIQNTPWALLLTNASDHVVYSNLSARQLFNAGHKLEGHSLSGLLTPMPEAFLEAVASGRDGMFSVRNGDEDDIYYLTRERFTLNVQRHCLYIFKQLTRELNRREVVIWKKVIRVISHELNNSLAPISSLAHSGRILAKEPDPVRLESVFSTIEERADHLKMFLDGYARFAKLPAPRIEPVAWESFVTSLQQLATFRLEGSLPVQHAYFDPVQIQQVLINLLKNAHESGSPPQAVTLTVQQAPQGIRFHVVDAGPGMPAEVLEQALMPFYSTKQSGTGLGLPLCREIVEAHGGRISLANRVEAGLHVSIWLPNRQITA